jgi:large subunit ribosomal protein L21
VYAVIRDRSKNQIVRVGDEIRIDLRRGARPGDEVSFEALLVSDGGKTRIGLPTVAGATVVGEVKGEARGEKLYPYRWRRRHGFRRKRGHRQTYLRVKIREIREG